MKIILDEKDVYGLPKYYPGNKLAETMATLLNQKTLTEQNINILQLGGFSVEINTPSYVTSIER